MFGDNGDKEETTIIRNLDSQRLPVLVVGHYCHDRITLPGGSRVDALGGSVSYIVNVFKALGMNAEVVSKVGPDFIYSHQLSSHLPHVIESHCTTEFFADFVSGKDRMLKVGNICEPIFPHDILPDQKFELGLAVGIAGEVLPETIERMAQNSRIVIADVQALIRNINPISGLVSLRRLEDTPYYSLLSSISFLKAARIEASFIDIEQVRKMTCVIVTEGKNGSRVYSKDKDFRVPPFHATELDPTGAGDCFLAGFSAGLYQGLSVYQAVRMGNYFGALAVEQIGVPHFTDKQLELKIYVHVSDLQLPSRFPSLLGGEAKNLVVNLCSSERIGMELIDPAFARPTLISYCSMSEIHLHLNDSNIPTQGTHLGWKFHTDHLYGGCFINFFCFLNISVNPNTGTLYIIMSMENTA